MQCPNCSETIPDDSLFCPECGHPIPQSTTEPAASAITTPPDQPTSPTAPASEPVVPAPVSPRPAAQQPASPPDPTVAPAGAPGSVSAAAEAQQASSASEAPPSGGKSRKGLWIGLGVAAVVVIIIVIAAIPLEEDDEPADEPFLTWEVGDCLVVDGDTAFLSSCADPHDGEVFHEFDMPDGPYPSADAIETAVVRECFDAFAIYVGVPASSSVLGVDFIAATPETWDNGDRQLACVLFDPEGPMIGSAEGAGI